MDIYSCFNSSDMGSYLESSGYTLDAEEMAYIVYLNTKMTLEQKMTAWKEIVETEPDLPMRKRHDGLTSSSVHDFLRNYIDLQKRELEQFSLSDNSVFYLSDCESVPFSTLDGCLKYARDEWGEEKSHEIHKARLDQVGDYRAGEQYLTLNAEFEPMEINVDCPDEGDWAIGYQFPGGFYALPCPFKMGDIVVDSTDADKRPFVFDYLKFWNSQEMASHGNAVEPDRARRLDASIEKANTRGSWDCSHMTAMGYMLSSDLRYSPIDCFGCVYFDDFGVCDNYINLEYYRGNLDGNRKLLGLISENLKGNISIELVINFAQLIMLEGKASCLKRRFDTEYVESARHLYSE